VAWVRSRRESGRFVRFFFVSGAETKEHEIYRDIPEELRELVEPVVDEHGCELVDVELLQTSVQSKGRGLLRITVDSPSADGRVPIQRCVGISREVETLLDAREAIPGAYQLEVSSPGLDRVLGREKDFFAAISCEVKLRTRRPIDGRKRFRGRLVSFESGLLKMNVDGEDALIPFDDVEKANSIYEFTSADFAKKSSRRGSSKSGGI
jgi:ribosome maturation factor RimP